jgi:predicted Fe-Mo cluster-binding NifX family protein
MKVAISATGPSLDAEVDPRFGRCQYIIVADTDTMEFNATENSNIMAGGGAGISTAQTVASLGAQAVLTGNCGPNAYQTLSAAGIQVITGVSGSVKDAIEGFKAGKFKAISGPSTSAHSGMGGGMGGGGRGMGMGRGMDMGSTPAPQVQSPDQEIEMLKGQTEMLKQQMDAIQHRLEELQKGG